MPAITEPTMHETIWEWLADQGYDVSGEVTLGEAGRIDLVAYDTANNEYLGVEVKNQENRNETVDIGSAIPGADVSDLTHRGGVQFEDAERYWKQLHRYQTSGYLDRLYFASQQPESVIDSITREPALVGYDGSTVEDIYESSDANPMHVGAMLVPGPHDDTSIEVVREASGLSRSAAPRMAETDERWVQHHIWRELGGVREGVLPNRNTTKLRRIDVAIFTGSEDPTEVYRNQATNDIVGIEAKGAGAIAGNAGSVRGQLLRYLESGALTRVSLAFPQTDASAAIELLTGGSDQERLDEVGLYTVDTDGHVEQVRAADKLPLEYDGIRTEEGYTVDVIWGYGDGDDWDPQEESVHRSVFDMRASS